MLLATGPARSDPPSTSAGQLTWVEQDRWALPAGALTAVCVLGLSLLAISQQRVPDLQATTANTVSYAISTATERIEAALPGQPIALTVLGRDRHYRRKVTFGLTYALDTVGYRPEVPQKYVWQLGSQFSYTGQRMPAVTVHMYASGGIQVVVRRHGSETAGT